MPLLRSKRNVSYSESVTPVSKKSKTEKLSTKKNPDKNKVAPAVSVAVDEKSDSSSSESDWEEVEIKDADIPEIEPVIPKEGITITIETGPKKKSKKAVDFQTEIIRTINRFQVETQISMHKVHLLGYLAFCLKINSSVNQEEIKALAFSCIPQKLHNLKHNLASVKKLLAFFNQTFNLDIKDGSELLEMEKFADKFDTKKLDNKFEYVCVFLVLLRALKFNSRLIVSFRPVSLKLPANAKLVVKNSQLKAGNSNKDANDNEIEAKIVKSKSERVAQPKKPASIKKNVKDKKKESAIKRRSHRVKSQKKVKYDEEQSENEENNDSDTDFEISEHSEEEEKEKRKASPSVRRQKVSAVDPRLQDEVWIEVFLEDEQRFVCADIFNQQFDQPKEFEAGGKAFDYVVGVTDAGCLLDLTRRYADDCLRPEYRKRRVNGVWWEETLQIYGPPASERFDKEMSELENQLLQRPLPNTISEYKGHPFYILQRHLLKFEGIYPPDAVPVGYFRKEPVFSRDTVHQLHARETWFKEARLVRRNETAYKVVKPRPRYNRRTREFKVPDKPLEIFGYWQTEDYVPPVAKDGVVPRNEHGNVDLLKPCMLPVGTVHLQLPGLNRVARKLNIDCGAAFVGWDFSGGSNHPVFDGWVVCAEFEEALVAAWQEEQELAKEREQAKKDKRVYGAWKRLIRGVLIAERLKNRYLTKK